MTPSQPVKLLSQQSIPVLVESIDWIAMLEISTGVWPSNKLADACSGRSGNWYELSRMRSDRKVNLTISFRSGHGGTPGGIYGIGCMINRVGRDRIYMGLLQEHPRPQRTFNLTMLITGGSGFLGSYFTRYAVAQGENPVLLDRYADRGRIDDVLDEVTLIEGDVADADLVNRIVTDHGVDRIAHFAFILGSPKPGQMLPYVQVQCLGTANVFEAARLAGVDRVLFGSSVAAYGRQDASLLTEELVVNPSEPYGVCKVWGEAMGRHYTEQLGLDVVSLRFGSTYGHGRGWRGSYSSGMLDVQPKVHYMARVDDAVRGQAIELPRDDAMADWTYAADAAQAAWLALTKPRLSYSLYNVAAERAPVGDFTRVLRKLLPDADVRTSTVETPGNAHAPMRNSRLVDDLGFVPAYSLESGVADYIERVRAYDRYHQRNG